MCDVDSVDQPTADPVQHLESVVEPAVFKAVPFQNFCVCVSL